MSEEYVNGYIERSKDGKYEGCIRIEGIDLSPIQGVMFQSEGKNYLWLRRKDKLEYDQEEQKYVTRKREPRWEAYLEKQLDEKSVVAFKGEFPFMRLRFSIYGIWDAVNGRDKSRINFYVDRLPNSKQDLLKRKENV